MHVDIAVHESQLTKPIEAKIISYSSCMESYSSKYFFKSYLHLLYT